MKLKPNDNLVFSTFTSEYDAYLKHIINHQRVEYLCLTCNQKLCTDLQDFLMIKDENNVTYLNINKNKMCNTCNKSSEARFISEPFCLLVELGNNINQNELNNEKYYQIILQKSNVSEVPEYFFKKEYHTFSLINKEIKDYGKCYIAEYYFNDALGYMQSKFYVIINTEKSEISIWNFDNLKVAKKGLECDFNVRGKHTIYNFFYSKECEKFIL
jgi:hypothetical protein